MNHYGDYQISLGNLADIFETEKSIFIFPYYNKIIGKKIDEKSWPKIISVDYNKPIRFTISTTEKITFNSENTFRKFEITQIKNDTIIEFKDKKFKTNIKLILKDYKKKLNIENNNT